MRGSTSSDGSAHVLEHDRWMTHPDDVDYLAPADRWCRVCGKLDRDHVCTTCGCLADAPYRNAAAGEGCIDKLHDAFTDPRTGAVYCAPVMLDVGGAAVAWLRQVERVRLARSPFVSR